MIATDCIRPIYIINNNNILIKIVESSFLILRSMILVYTLIIILCVDVFYIVADNANARSK